MGGLILCTASYGPTNQSSYNMDLCIHKLPSFLSGIIARNKRSSIARLKHMTVRQPVHGEHSCISKSETRNRLRVSILLPPDGETSRAGCHTRRFWLKLWRQLSRRTDPASSATATSTSTCSSTTTEFGIVSLSTSFRWSELGR